MNYSFVRYKLLPCQCKPVTCNYGCNITDFYANHKIRECLKLSHALEEIGMGGVFYAAGRKAGKDLLGLLFFYSQDTKYRSLILFDPIYVNKNIIGLVFFCSSSSFSQAFDTPCSLKRVVEEISKSFLNASGRIAVSSRLGGLRLDDMS